MKLTRREFLRLSAGLSAGMTAAGTTVTRATRWVAPTYLQTATPPTAPPDTTGLEAAIRDAVGSQLIGVDLRRLDANQQVVFAITINQEPLYPVASCFKAFLVYFYFWNTPPEQWQTGPESDAYRVAVFSDNVRTGFLLRDAAAAVEVYGNALEKFNDCLLYNIGMTHGIHTWDWAGNPLIGFTDPRFEPSEERVVNVRGVAHRIDNVTTPTDLANGYTFLAQAAAGTLAPRPLDPFFDMERAQRSAQAALDLLAIPAANYDSPLERAGTTGYIGKDGILRQSDISTGNVVGDAGLVQVGDQRYVIAFISVSQSEYAAVLTLTALVDTVRAFEGV